MVVQVEKLFLGNYSAQFQTTGNEMAQHVINNIKT